MEFEYFRLRCNEKLEGHSHSNLHICLIKSGGFTENYDDLEKDCDSETIRISPASARHNLTAYDSYSRESHGAIVELPYHTIRGLPAPLTSSVFINSLSAQRIKDKIFQSWENEDQFSVESAALELVARAVSNAKELQVPHWLDEFKLELLSSSENPYSLAKLANRFGRHRSHISRSFRKWYGRTPSAHICSFRLSAAERSLRESDQPIVQIALEQGFVDQAHFSKAFVQQFRQPPARYRKFARGQS